MGSEMCIRDRYYISVSLGKILVDEVAYFAISPEAPLSKLLIGRKAGDKIRFRDKEILVLGIE